MYTYIYALAIVSGACFVKTQGPNNVGDAKALISGLLGGDNNNFGPGGMDSGTGDMGDPGSVDIGGPKVNMDGSVNIGGSADMDGSIDMNGPNVDISGSRDMGVPKADMGGANVDMSGTVDTGVPKVDMGGSVDMDGQGDVGGSMDIGGPNADMSGTVDMGGHGDMSLSVDMGGPNADMGGSIDMGVSKVDMGIPKVDIGGSVDMGGFVDMDGQSDVGGSIDIGGPNADMSGTVDMGVPKVNMGGPNVDMSGSVDTGVPKVDMGVPKVDMGGSVDMDGQGDVGGSINIGGPNVDMSGSVDMGVPKVDMGEPKVDMGGSVDIGGLVNVDGSNVNIIGPKVDIGGPNIDLSGSMDMGGPNVDIGGPVDVGGQVDIGGQVDLSRPAGTSGPGDIGVSGPDATGDATSASDLIPVGRFTRKRLDEMIAGTETSLRYNYQGELATADEKALTLKQLERFVRDIDFGGSQRQPIQFTLNDILRMIDGMKRGLKFNSQGNIASAGEDVLSPKYLNERKKQLEAQSSTLSPQFTLHDIQRMIDGIKTGLKYNIHGQVTTGDAEISLEYLTDQKFYLETQGPTSQSVPFTLADVERMIAGIDNGLVYNTAGQIAQDGDELLTIQQLNDLKITYQQQVPPAETQPSKSFTIDDLKSILPNIDVLTGDGVPAVTGQPSLSKDGLFSLLQDLESKAASEPAKSPGDTLVDVNPVAGLSGQPDTSAVKPDTSAVKPDTSAGQPDTPAVKPDTPAVQPDTPAVQPDTPAVKPDTPAVKPDTPAVKPDTPAVKPDTPAVQPDTPAVQPDTPAVKPDTPAVKPDTPAVKPDTPAVKPDTPAVQPDTPAVQPDTPAVKPDTPAVKPDTPAVQPDTPAVQPDTPAVQPDTPAVKPDTPAVKPDTPAVQPDTPAVQPGTASEPTVEIYVAPAAEGQAPQTKTFTRQQITNMLDGTLAGKAYSFTGIEDSSSQSTFSQYQLEGLSESLDRMQQMGSIVSLDMFTRDDILRMITGTEQAGLYNEQGMDASPGESVLPLSFLKSVLELLPDRPNIALNAVVTLSSESNRMWIGANVVDGITATEMTTNSCFQTAEQLNPYVIVNLLGVYGVDSIVIYKPDIPIASLEISTGVSPYSFTPQQVVTNPLTKSNVAIDPVQNAQYIKITAVGDKATALALCEIEVYGDYMREDLCGMSPCQNGGTCTNQPDKLCACTKGWEGSNCETSNENIALGKPTVMSSLFENNLRYEGLKAVDGNSNPDMNEGSCFQTKLEMNPSIAINLGAVFEVQRIKLVNRGDCCADKANNVVIEAGLTSADTAAILSKDGPLGSEYVFSNIPPGTQGQFITVKLNNPDPSILHLCEIEIYGKYVRADQCGGGNPCQNGGTCTNRIGDSNCLCQEGYRGIYCTLEKQNATADPTDEQQVGWDWVKARIDPSVCLEYSCNLPICYVPYRKDCKSYVVCQRTATRSYVAWKMRCAFGSYWGKGKMWTCESVEDLATKGYTCPNDPCVLDKSLKTYPDEDVRNCRTYWKCDKGISKPACCPPGQMFDREGLICKHDPQDQCRSPCPLKIEGCAGKANHNVSFYDSNCRTYWGCNNGHAHPECCPARMSFDSSKGQCVKDLTCEKSCPAEYAKQVCHGPNAVKSYKLSDGLCRSYMKCNPTGEYDEPYCCRQEYYYDSTTDTCERVTNASDICNFEVCPGYKEECRLTAIKEKPRMYFDTDAGLERSCAYGAKFNQDICTCAGNDKVNEYKACKPEVWNRFDTTNKWQIQNYGDGSVSPYGNLMKNSTTEGLFYGEFDGSSGVQAWKYDHIALPSFNLEMTFLPSQSGGSEQILASNCRSTEDEGKASLEIILLPQTSEVKFSANSKLNSTLLVMPYDTSDWNTLKIVYNGDVVGGEIQAGLGTKPAISKFASMTGDIVPAIGSFKFGPCKNEIGAPKNNGFVGKVTEIKFAKCVDKKGKEFIKNNKNGNDMQ